MESNPRPPREPVRISTNDPLSSLYSWIAEGQVDEAARARARQRWLERQAAEEASLVGVLLDLAERNRPVNVTTTGGHRVSGPIVAVGADFGVLRDQRLGDAIVPTVSIALVRPTPGDDLPVGDRAVNMVLAFGDALMELAPDRPECIVAVGSEQLRGDVRSVSPDVVVLALDGDRRDLVHISVGAIDHVTVLRR
ncbi:MAG: hypothetical protein AAGC53_13120 [Actinomycetota bacterium]